MALVAHARVRMYPTVLAEIRTVRPHASIRPARSARHALRRRRSRPATLQQSFRFTPSCFLGALFVELLSCLVRHRADVRFVALLAHARVRMFPIVLAEIRIVLPHVSVRPARSARHVIRRRRRRPAAARLRPQNDRASRVAQARLPQTSRYRLQRPARAVPSHRASRVDARSPVPTPPSAQSRVDRHRRRRRARREHRSRRARPRAA